MTTVIMKSWLVFHKVVCTEYQYMFISTVHEQCINLGSGYLCRWHCCHHSRQLHWRSNCGNMKCHWQSKLLDSKATIKPGKVCASQQENQMLVYGLSHENGANISYGAKCNIVLYWKVHIKNKRIKLGQKFKKINCVSTDILSYHNTVCK